MRNKIDMFCAGYKGMHGGGHESKSSQRHLTIYQRDLDRRLLNIETVLEQMRIDLRERYKRAADVHSREKYDWTMDIIHHNESTPPCLLYRQLSRTDLFLTAHGFQSMLLLFMPKGSQIIEIFNYKYWKIGYAPLALNYGLRHHWLQNVKPTSWSRVMLRLLNQDWCMNSTQCRHIARTDDIHLTNDMISVIVDKMLQ